MYVVSLTNNNNIDLNTNTAMVAQLGLVNVQALVPAQLVPAKINLGTQSLFIKTYTVCECM